MHRFFSKPETLLRLRRGPLGDYLDQYAVWLSEQGFCRVHTRLAIVSGYFALRGYAGDLWKGIAISGAFSISYLVSVWAAFAVELYSPFLNNQERGNVSGQHCLSVASPARSAPSLPFHSY